MGKLQVWLNGQVGVPSHYHNNLQTCRQGPGFGAQLISQPLATHDFALSGFFCAKSNRGHSSENPRNEFWAFGNELLKMNFGISEMSFDVLEKSMGFF